jgi:DnaJ-class molecular chaperone
MKKDWKKIRCHDCGGHGLVCVYTRDGSDFEGAGECNTCEGNGILWQHKSGALAKWIGGPFVGHAGKSHDV